MAAPLPPGLSIAAFEVGYVCGDGAEHRVPLTEALAVGFEQGLPVRLAAGAAASERAVVVGDDWRACRVRVLAGTHLLALDFDPAVTPRMAPKPGDHSFGVGGEPIAGRDNDFGIG